MNKKKVLAVLMAGLCSSVAFAADVWQWSNSGQYYYYRDNDGRVHYSDGSIGPLSEVWFDSTGKAVYSANSKGPADKTGQYAIQQPRIDEASVGPAPKSPPANAVLVYPDSSKPTFGPAPTGPSYIVTDCHDFGFFKCSKYFEQMMKKR